MVNSSSSFLLPAHLLLISPSLHCFVTKPSLFILTVIYVASIIIPLPIMVLTVSHGVKQWRQSVSTSSGVRVSHSDVFTYHMVVIELIGILGFLLHLSFSVSYDVDLDILLVGNHILNFHWYGQAFFHVLTCLERHLAVVHPITYLSLRGERGNRLRNIITVCVWPLNFVWTFLTVIKNIVVAEICFYILTLMIVSFCSLSVLCVLIHPGPGERLGGWARVDQSKQRAFYTILAILGSLLLRFIGSLVWLIVYISEIKHGCLIMASIAWCGIPSSVVLPLLFLHRAEKLVCCKKQCPHPETPQTE